MRPWIAVGVLGLTLCCAGQLAPAAEQESKAARKRELILANLEKRTSDLLTTRVALRQQLLDAGPQLSRRVCENARDRMAVDPGFFKVARSDIALLERQKPDEYGDPTAEQSERLERVKKQIALLEEDPPPNCKALAPIND
jgi:hypothetical protein